MQHLMLEGHAWYLLFTLLLHLRDAGSILEVAVLLQSLTSLLQLPAAVLQLLYVVLLLYDGALVLLLLCPQMAHIFLQPLNLQQATNSANGYMTWNKL